MMPRWMHTLDRFLHTAPCFHVERVGPIEISFWVRTNLYPRGK